MKNKKSIVKNTGFSYVEAIYSLCIIINLFVLLSQIFYNINIETDLLKKKRAVEYEVVFVRIEHQLKEATDLNVSVNLLSFCYRNQDYEYYVSNNKLTLQIDNNKNFYYLLDIKEVKFFLHNHHINIELIDMDDEIYEGKILFP